MEGDAASKKRDRIEAVFDALIDASDSERDEILERECGEDVELRRDVEALLAAHDRAAGILEADAVAAAGALIDTPREERIGPYRVLRRIGRGGMGIVYLAERDDGQFRRRVAIKVLPSGAEDVQLYRRFLAERQILASLDHPNIARLLDGGMTDAGLPYLVLEYVDGLPITEYCDRHRLAVGDRLRLFQTTADAVHFAHQNLVIHRDIKPGNIFVGEDGVVKLLDFGIAKLLNPGLFPVPLPVTRTEHRVLTPEYASPEQLRGEPITTVSDVYSLGVVLYELLAGRHPYRLTRRSPEQIIRAVCEVDPERPSTRVGRSEPATGDPESDTTPVIIGEARSTTPDRLRRRLRGDLDAIVMMALRKEPNRRYASAELLSADIGRFLDNLPVAAHRGSGLYRLGKLTRRHRLGAAAAILVVASISAGAGAALWQASVARTERDAAERARGETEIALQESRAVSDFLMGLFEVNAPGETQGDTVTASELLQRGIGRADQLDGSPAVQARMLDVIGRVYERMGEFDLAASTLERALAIRRTESGLRSPETAETLGNLALVETRRGNYVRAIDLATDALDIRRETLGDADTLTTNTMATLAGLLIYRGRLDESEALYREALALQEASLGPDDPTVAQTLTTLASTLHRRGRSAEAEAMLRRALAIRERNPGSDEGLTAEVMFSLGDVIQQSSGDTDEAVDLFRRGVAMERRVYGDNSLAYTSASTRFADFLSSAGLNDEADRAFAEALATRSRVLGPNHPSMIEMRTGFAAHLHRTGRDQAADSIFRTELPHLIDAFGSEHTKVAQAELNWAAVRASLGDHTQAMDLARDALRIRRNAAGRETTLVGLTLADIAELDVKAGDFAEADSLFHRSLDILLRSYPPDHFDVRMIHARMAAFYELQGKADLAASHREAATGH